MVDPSPGALGAAHRRARRVLAGAAVRARARRPTRGVIEAPVDEPVARVLVTTGAADADGVGARIARRSCRRRRRVPAWRSGSSSGPWGATDVPRGVVPVHAPDGLAAELAAASVVVTAGGVTLLEACLLGRPIVALALAENQRQAVYGLEREGAVVVATPETVADGGARAGRRSRAAGSRSRSPRGRRSTARARARVADMLEQLVSR